MTQITFTENEVKQVAAFVQLVYDKATFSGISTKDCIAVPRHFQFMQEHIKKMDAHIMELVRITPAPTKAKKKKATKKKAKKR